MELFNKEGHLTDEGLRAVVDGTLDNTQQALLAFARARMEEQNDQ